MDIVYLEIHQKFLHEKLFNEDLNTAIVLKLLNTKQLFYFDQTNVMSRYCDCLVTLSR